MSSSKNYQCDNVCKIVTLDTQYKSKHFIAQLNNFVINLMLILVRDNEFNGFLRKKKKPTKLNQCLDVQSINEIL